MEDISRVQDNNTRCCNAFTMFSPFRWNFGHELQWDVAVYIDNPPMMLAYAGGGVAEKDYNTAVCGWNAFGGGDPG